MKSIITLLISLSVFKCTDAVAQLSSYKPIKDTSAPAPAIIITPPATIEESKPVLASNTNVLPNLKATISQGNVFLNWSTATENGIDHFGVRFSTDGTNWVELTTVKATGNLETGINYKWPHANPLLGLNYYQIAIVYRNGKIFYSDIAKANITGRTNDVSFIVYPNPSYIGIINVMGTNTKGLTVIRSTGENVTSKIKLNTFTDNGGEIDISQLAAGTYYLHLHGKIQTFSKN